MVPSLTHWSLPRFGGFLPIKLIIQNFFDGLRLKREGGKNMEEREFKSSKVQGSKDQGSRVKTFEDLNVYKQGRDLTNKIYELTRQKKFARDYGLRDQIRRAPVSIMSNIAEGFERGTNAEFSRFLFIAKGSCGEVRAQLSISFDQQYIGENVYQELTNQCPQVSGMLSNLITYLKDSKFKGSKFQKINP
jgi:four helix bundle protein